MVQRLLQGQNLKWIYKGIELNEPIEHLGYGFVYMIRYTDGTYYYGKKAMWSTVRMKPTQAQLAIRKNYKRVVTKPNDWKKYTGSTAASKGKTIHSKHVLSIAVSKVHLSYLEYGLLFQEEVLMDEVCLNGNIGGKFYDNVLEPKGEWLKEVNKEKQYNDV